MSKRDYYQEGLDAAAKGKDEEAIEAFRQSLVDNYDVNAHICMGNSYMRLGKLTEAIECYAKHLKERPNNDNYIAFMGSMLEDNGNVEEARKNYLLAIEKNPKTFKGNTYLGRLLFKEGKPEEALKHYLVVLPAYPNEPIVVYQIGCIYRALGREQEAIESFRKARNANIVGAVQFCYRGQCFNVLGEKEKALADFKVAQDKLNTDNRLFYTPSYIQHIKTVLKSILNVEESAKEVETEIKKADTSNPALTKFVNRIKELQEEKDKLQTKAIETIGQGQTQESQNVISDFDKLKQEYAQQLAAFKEEMTKKIVVLDTKVQNIENEVTTLKSNLEDLKEEVSNKMSDYEKMLLSELGKRDLPADDIKNLNAYFKAFVETFSSTHVTSQVIDSGQVQLDSDSRAATVLSFVASFAPFIGSGLSTAVKSVGDFLQTKEMKTNARKMKRLASDATKLSQVVGKAAYEILLDKEKQQSILKTTDSDLAVVSDNLFKKIFQFCENLEDKLDSYLYTELYQSIAERVGHNDANDLIGKWINGEITPYNVENQFVNQTLKKGSESKTTESSPATLSPTKKAPATVNNPSCACNIF